LRVAKVNDKTVIIASNALTLNPSSKGFRPCNGLVFLRRMLSSGNSDYLMVFGIPGDTAMAGDWNSNGHDTLGIYRPSNARFYLTNEMANGPLFSTIDVSFGGVGRVVAGDWDGSEKTGLGWFTGTQFLLRNSLTDGNAEPPITYGPTGSDLVPVAGKWIVGAAPVSNPLWGLLVNAPPGTHIADDSGRAD
jgi:hypothetical protein